MGVQGLPKTSHRQPHRACASYHCRWHSHYELYFASCQLDEREHEHGARHMQHAANTQICTRDYTGVFTVRVDKGKEASNSSLKTSHCNVLDLNEHSYHGCRFGGVPC